ncbi:MAG: hypothetical protein KKG00_14780, partial [Bacteroidetes bacterium]|nr:hypothetical protein [Bacteroidota bacterium]
MLKILLDWSEVWALILPLTVYQFHRRQPIFFRPVWVYLWGALVLNVASDTIGDFKSYFPDWMQTNLILYNIHSFFRFYCFAYFFSLVSQTYFTGFRRSLPFMYFIFALANYIFFEDYLDQNHLSGNLFTLEAYFLLIYCILFYLSRLREEVDKISEGKEFWIVTGLSIYVVINFFIFLFYVPMVRENPMLAERMWGVHNVAY